MKKFGNPFTDKPRLVFSPSAHLSRRSTPPSPTMSTRVSVPVMASKPVAHMMTSSSYNWPLTTKPFSVTSSIGCDLVSTRWTLSRL